MLLKWQLCWCNISSLGTSRDFNIFGGKSRKTQRLPDRPKTWNSHRTRDVVIFITPEKRRKWRHPDPRKCVYKLELYENSASAAIFEDKIWCNIRVARQADNAIHYSKMGRRGASPETPDERTRKFRGPKLWSITRKRVVFQKVSKKRE